jgi:hypothetical protein
MNEEQHQELVSLLRENLRLSKRIQATVEKTERHIFWMKVMNVVKVVLIAIPIVLALIYLPPAIQRLTGTYQEVFETFDRLKTGNVEAQDANLLRSLIP